MSEADKMAKEKEMALDELLAQTEEKITNPDYIEDGEVEYKNILVKFSFKPFKQKEFTKIQKRLNKPEGTALILSGALINNATKDKRFYTEEEIGIGFEPGLADNIAEYILKSAGYNTDKAKMELMKKAERDF